MMNHPLRLVAPLLNALLLACGDYSDADPVGSNAETTTPISTTPAATTPSATMPAATPPETTTPAVMTTAAGTTTGATSAPSSAPPTTPAEPVTASCENVAPCGGDVVGTWTVGASCLPVTGNADLMGFGLGCVGAPTTGDLQVTGTLTFNADGSIVDETTTTGDQELTLPAACLDVSGTITTCDRVGAPLQALGFAQVTCTSNADAGCACPATVNQTGGAAYLTLSPLKKASYSTADSVLTVTNRRLDVIYSYCVEGTTLTLSLAGASKTGPVSGTIVLQKQ